MILLYFLIGVIIAFYIDVNEGSLDFLSWLVLVFFWPIGLLVAIFKKD